MIESGEVVRLEKTFAYIRFVRSSACGNCTACGMSADKKEIEIRVENTKDVKIGEFVDVEIDSKKALFSSAAAYVFPLIMLILGALVGSIVSDIFAAVLAIVFTLAAYIILKVLDPFFKKKIKTTYRMK